MRLRAGNHRATAAARSLTIVVMAAAMAAQLLSISHEMTVRHFRCAEHGELTHVAALSAAAAELPLQGAPETRATNEALRARDAEAADTHEHCGVTFTVQGSSCLTAAGDAVPLAERQRVLLRGTGVQAYQVSALLGGLPDLASITVTR